MRENVYRHVYTQVLNVETALSAANYPTSGSYIDVSAYRHCAFKIYVGAIDSATTCAVYQDTSATQTASIKALTSATVTVGTGDDNETFTIEFETNQLDVANSFKYVTLTLTGPAGSNDYACIVFEGWGAYTEPVTQPAAYPSTNYVELVG